MKVFDFDNTIYKGETMVDFFYFMIEKKEELKKYKPLVEKFLFLYHHNLLPMNLIKKTINKYKNSVSGFSTANVETYVKEFWKTHEDKIDKDMLKLIGKDDVIMTASLNVLIDPIKKKLKTKNIYTSIVDVDKREIIFMCYKENKASKYKELYKDKPIDELYTDSYADKPLMNLAKKVFFIDRDTREIKQIK